MYLGVAVREYLSLPARSKLLGIVLALFLADASAAHTKTCSTKDAEAADAAVDHLDSWIRLQQAFKRYRHCDDGSIAEGNSEAIARLLVDHWNTLPVLATLVKSDPGLKRFVLRHIDTTLDTADLYEISRLSSSHCPEGVAGLCGELKTAAKTAAR
jgi:hypothetical protein